MTRADLHHLVDALPEESFEPVAVFLQRAQDPTIAILDAGPWEDELISPEEEAAVAQGRAEIARGEGIPWEQVKAELDAAG